VRVIAECKNENRLESEFSLLAEVVKFNCSTLLQLEAALAVRPVLRGNGTQWATVDMQGHQLRVEKGFWMDG